MISHPWLTLPFSLTSDCLYPSEKHFQTLSTKTNITEPLTQPNFEDPVQLYAQLSKLSLSSAKPLLLEFLLLISKKKLPNEPKAEACLETLATISNLVFSQIRNFFNTLFHSRTGQKKPIQQEDLKKLSCLVDVKNLLLSIRKTSSVPYFCLKALLNNLATLKKNTSSLTNELSTLPSEQHPYYSLLKRNPSLFYLFFLCSSLGSFTLSSQVVSLESRAYFSRPKVDPSFREEAILLVNSYISSCVSYPIIPKEKLPLPGHTKPVKDILFASESAFLSQLKDILLKGEVAAQARDIISDEKDLLSLLESIASKDRDIPFYLGQEAPGEGTFPKFSAEEEKVLVPKLKRLLTAVKDFFQRDFEEAFLGLVLILTLFKRGSSRFRQVLREILLRKKLTSMFVDYSIALLRHFSLKVSEGEGEKEFLDRLKKSSGKQRTCQGYGTLKHLVQGYMEAPEKRSSFLLDAFPLIRGFVGASLGLSAEDYKDYSKNLRGVLVLCFKQLLFRVSQKAVKHSYKSAEVLREHKFASKVNSIVSQYDFPREVDKPLLVYILKVAKEEVRWKEKKFKCKAGKLMGLLFEHVYCKVGEDWVSDLINERSEHYVKEENKAYNEAVGYYKT